MSLREKINQQFNAALKNKDKTLVSTLRLIMAAIKDRDIANRSGEKKGESKDQEIIKVLQKMKKQLRWYTLLSVVELESQLVLLRTPKCDYSRVANFSRAFLCIWLGTYSKKRSCIGRLEFFVCTQDDTRTTPRRHQDDTRTTPRRHQGNDRGSGRPRHRVQSTLNTKNCSSVLRI